MIGEVLWALVGVLFGVLLGAATAVALTERAQRRAAEMFRTGRPDVTASGVAGRRVTASAEAAALAHISEASIDEGADQIMARYKEAGFSIDRKRAIREARDMIEAADPLGGAH